MALPILPRACTSNERITQVTVIAMLPEGSPVQEYMKSLDPDQWSITSFDSNTRVVCFDIEADKGDLVHHMSVTLPHLSTSSLSPGKNKFQALSGLR